MSNKPIGIEVSLAAAEAAALANVDVVAAYPITPKPTWWSTWPSWWRGQAGRRVHRGGERAFGHERLSGAAAAGARTFTATASQGLLLMHEILFLVATSGCRW